MKKLPSDRTDVAIAETFHGRRTHEKAGVAGSLVRSFAKVAGERSKPEVDCILMKRENMAKNASWLSNSLVGIVRWKGIIPSISGLYEACGI